jgi:hypothetical protein
MLNLKCFLHQGINELYIPLHIADYQEDGLSCDLNTDPAFKKDFPRFVKKELGIKAYIICRAKMKNPDALYFTHSLGYGLLYETLLRPLIPVARPFVRGYRSLKKTITNSK